MKMLKAIRFIGAGMAMYAASKIVTMAYVASSDRKSRIWVQYKPGQKDTVRELLRHVGAIFHYDFSDLDSFVVTLPKGSIKHIARHPQVADYWYASMMSRDETIDES